MATPEPTGYSELAGLRAWLAEVDRMLGIRTRIGLVLLALAAGLGGAALYLALDTRDNAADADDVAALRSRVQRLEARGASTAALRSRVDAAESDAAAARSQVAELQTRVDRLERQARSIGARLAAPTRAGLQGPAAAGRGGAAAGENGGGKGAKQGPTGAGGKSGPTG
jgi:polyhydroxyalkanoate synthesis regulator phasin